MDPDRGQARQPSLEDGAEDGAIGDTAADVAVTAPARRAANPVTGKPAPGGRYAASTAAHCESVLRQFYDFHLEAGSGPMVNPFPLGRRRRGGRAGAHHNPMAAHRDERSGLFRPRLAQRIPRSIPDERFSELFAQLALASRPGAGRVVGVDGCAGR